MLIGLLLAVSLVPQPVSVMYKEGKLSAVKKPRIEYVEDSSIPPEGYKLSVKKSGVTISSSDKAGRFYAMRTLDQLSEGKFYPCVEITDAPQYRWRGVLIDECRHFFGKECIKSVLDLMAQHKLNTLHWHLTDDQGWRLEIPGYPELTRTGAVRPGSPKFAAHVTVNVKNYQRFVNDERYGPFYYTEKDIREIVAYAAERHIRIVPEIEIPGHFYAALAAYPDLACFPERLKGKTPLCVWGIEKDVLCLGNDDSLKLLEDVLEYVCRVFPGDTVHIGGDECPMVRWKSCPRCARRMKAEGIGSVNDYQSWITRRIVKFLEKRGKRTVGWDEYLLGNVPKSAIGMSWRAGGGGAGHKFLTPKECVMRGHDLVMTPRTHCYLDYRQGLKNDPFYYIGGNVTLQKSYSFNPMHGIPDEYRSKILGGQGNNWSEYTWGRFDLEWKMWPRTCALAEALWTGDKRPGFADFSKRMEKHRKRLLDRNVNCAPLK